MFYMKADQGAHEHNFAFSQVLDPLMQLKPRLGPNVADVYVQCKRQPAECKTLLWNTDYSEHWGDPIRMFWAGTRRFALRGLERLEDLPGQEELGVGDASTPEAIADFVAWAGRASPADARTLLVIWGHGGGYALPLLRYTPPGGGARMRILSGQVEQVATPPPQPTLFSGPLEPARLLSLPDFRAGIEQGLERGPRDHLDVLVFNSCFMACIEAAYELRNVATVMVASEESTPFEQWRHGEWIDELANGADLDAGALGRMLVRRYGADRLNHTTVSAVWLGTRIEELTSAIRGFVDTALAAGEADPSLWTALAAARSRTGTYGAFGGSADVLGVDIRRWFHEAARETADPVRERAVAVREACKAAVIDHAAAAGRRGAYGSEGLSIFFPATRADFDRLDMGRRYDPASGESSGFVRASLWRKFLEAYWRHVPAQR